MSRLGAVRAVFALALLSTIPHRPLAGQVNRAGQISLGMFGAYTRFDANNLGLKGQFGAGARLGLALTSLLTLEANGDFTPTQLTGSTTAVNVTRIGGSLLAFTKPGLYLGAGYDRVYYRGALTFEDNAPHAVLGVRLPLGGRAAFRAEIRGAYFFDSPAPAATGKPLNVSGNLGFSIYSFGGPKRDSDKDGVIDKADRCPATPERATVNPEGCPRDADTDLVFDGIDNCPATPRGATVDAGGCPADADTDGVFDGIDTCAGTPAGALADVTGCPSDGDGDRVFDGLDQCAATPAGATTDATGCPLDADADKVFDGLDQCSDTPAGTAVDGLGCAVATDADGDGVSDTLDRCPNTAAGTKVNETGCPVDADRDGVENPADKCPNTSAGTKVDAMGCPILFEIVEGVAKAVVLRGVNFQSGRSALTPQSFTVLDEVAASLVANPSVRIEIGGHTDSTGVRARNITLSQARSQAVRSYLASKGVAPDRMVARGYGPDRPAGPNSTPTGRAQNRRVELNLIP